MGVAMDRKREIAYAQRRLPEAREALAQAMEQGDASGVYLFTRLVRGLEGLAEQGQADDVPDREPADSMDGD